MSTSAERRAIRRRHRAWVRWFHRFNFDRRCERRIGTVDLMNRYRELVRRPRASLTEAEIDEWCRIIAEVRAIEHARRP